LKLKGSLFVFPAEVLANYWKLLLPPWVKSLHGFVTWIEGFAALESSIHRLRWFSLR